MAKNYCVVQGCRNSSGLLRKKLEGFCDIHKGQPRESCPCPAPQEFFSFPQDESHRKEWMLKVHLQDDLFDTRLRVCSVHFRDGKPTEDSPYPELNLDFNVNSHSDLLARGLDYNKHHQKNLQLFCRLCGDNECVVTKACKVHPKHRFEKDIFSSMAIDVNQDSCTVHPRNICYVCRAKLSAWKSAMQKGRPIDLQIKPAKFVPHDEPSKCLVCLNQSLRNYRPPQMSSNADSSNLGLDKPLAAMEGGKNKDEEDKLYVFDFKIDMDDLISSTLKDLEDHEDASSYQSDFTKFSQQLRSIERKTKEVRKIYTECSEKLRIYREELEEADREEELKEAAAEIDAKEAAEANAKVDEESDEDDVQFVATSYDPSVMEKRQVIATQNKNLVSALSSSPKMEPLTIPPGAVLVKLPPISQSQSGTTPSLQSLRNALAGAINKQIPSVSQSTTTVINTAPAGSRFVQSNSLQNQQRMETMYRADVETIEIGGKILGKKFNDIWYKGTVSDIQSKDKAIEERRYSIKFDGKGKKVLSPKHVAFKDPIVRQIYVGTRVIALYRDEDSTSSYYAGIVAETPNGRNQQRYLIFFDDGYAQYSLAADINKVLWQSANVWEDIHPDSQEFIKEYLKQYPERPMVRLQKGQMVKTEWNGKWWTAKVMEVDASLVKMFFLADKRVEWIYRGSTRLEPLYTALANAEYNKSAGKVRRHTNTTVGKAPVVEYTRGISDSYNQQAAVVGPVSQVNKTPSPQVPVTLNRHSPADKKRPVARKSTSGRPSADWEGPWVKQTRPGNQVDIKSKEFVASSISSQKVGKDMASVLQDRLSKTTDNTDLDDDSLGQRMESKLPFKDRVRKKFRTHNCGKDCLKDCEDDPTKYKGGNPLLIPLLCGWERHVCKMKPNHKRVVMYRTPCARRLRSMEDVFTFLMLCDSHLTIDMFCFDPILHVHTEFVPVKTFCDIKDLSYGKENVPISCVNAHDRQYPDYVEYSNVRIPAKGVKLNLDPDFLVCCSCTDGCSDRTKCECQQLTVEATGIVEGGKKNPNAGYEHRRLKEPLTTGVYECNSRCKCDSRCYNRAAQNGLNVRLQVFKTEKKGWGLRCLDDLPSGGFICIYAGQLLTEQGANEDGQQYGDEYLAELDYMEVVERQKEGYESDVDIDEGVGGDSDDDDEDSDRHFSDSDSDFSANGHGEKVSSTDLMDLANTHRTRLYTGSETSTRMDKTTKDEKEDKKSIGKIVLRRDSSRSGSKDDEWYSSGDIKKQNQQKSVRFQENPEKNAATAAWVNEVGNGNPITIDDEGEDMDTSESKLKKSASVDSFGMDSDSLPDLDTEAAPKEEIKKSIEVPIEKKEEPKPPMEFPDPRRTCLTARRSTSKTSRFKNLPDPKKKLPQEENKVEEVEEDEENKDEKPGTRYYFHDGQECYIMDAKSMGNIGRYLNHSCSPNVFVQNVFVDTHDLRFPWVTFFAGQYIRAGTELTWDYNYEVGSVPGKILYCYCGSAECRGRLL
ncbi:histone-lysine N-methyltransferase SETDB1-B-like isoform X3 [Mizuhopecten yessoensis]|uniref:histone-lysine N-methyltransferase SETDB1-B-like isoform X3 n=1 Tax=Mizuhopecten yessoensis TaxID=6573 RepID=UPI000B457B87|nr:histone-lysine N-methyltransferase SETDB1-B-like isoform X3 [Mizuhopecten yessoensis]